MRKKFEWLIKKTPRSVDQLRLWPENPRLNPESDHFSLKDFAEDLTYENSDKSDFKDLVKSIVDDGFVPADPVVVWQNEENKKFYVAEGNRRVTVLKLLREPHKSPKSIRGFMISQSAKIDTNEIEKILVNVAPTFEEAEWYINQRNSASSLQRRWSSVQQRRWIVNLYTKHEGDIEKILSITKLSRPELEGTFRILKIKDFIKQVEVKSKLTDEEFDKANSYRFPITILERFFNFSDVREKWGLEFDGLDVEIKSNKDSFYNAFSELIKRIVNNKEDNKINTRLTKEDLDEVLESLPSVNFDSDDSDDSENEESNDSNSESEDDNETDSSSETGSSNASQTSTTVTVQQLKGNPNRSKLVLSIYDLNTDSFRLLGLFNEFKKISLGHKNVVSAGLRVFLDLAVLKYIETEGITNDISRQYQEQLRNISLKKRLEYIKTNHLSGKVQTIVTRLIDPSQQYSLDVLNGYIHGQDTHYLNKQFLNGFWDFLFPLFEVLLDIREK